MMGNGTFLLRTAGSLAAIFMMLWCSHGEPEESTAAASSAAILKIMR